MDKTFSILWPLNCSKSSFSLNKQIIKDLNIQEIWCEALVEQLNNLPVELEVINYRQEIISDLLYNPDLLESLNDFTIVPDKLNNLYSILKASVIKSDGLKQFRKILITLVESLEYQQFAIKQMKDLRSITIGFNIDEEMNPVGVKVLSTDVKEIKINEEDSYINNSHDFKNFISNICSNLISNKFNLSEDYKELVQNYFSLNIFDEIKFYISSVKLIRNNVNKNHESATLSNGNYLTLLYGKDLNTNCQTIYSEAISQIMFQLGLVVSSDFSPVDGIYLYSGKRIISESEYSQDFFKINQLIKNASESSLILINNSFEDSFSTVNLFLAKGILKNISRLKCRALVATSFSELADFAKNSNIEVGVTV